MGIFRKSNHNNNKNNIITTSKYKEKQVVLDYMNYFGIGIEKIHNSGIEYYMIRKISDKFSNSKLKQLTDNNISFFEYYLIIPPKTKQMAAYRTLDEAYTALEYLYNVMKNSKLDCDF